MLIYGAQYISRLEDSDIIFWANNFGILRCAISNIAIRSDEKRATLKVISCEDGKIALQADNGKFLSRTDHYGVHRIEAEKDEIDTSSKFTIERW